MCILVVIPLTYNLDLPSRLQRPPAGAGIARYKRKAETKSILDTAAKLWANGVKFDDALQIARKTEKEIQTRSGKGKGKGRGKR